MNKGASGRPHSHQGAALGSNARRQERERAGPPSDVAPCLRWVGKEEEQRREQGRELGPESGVDLGLEARGRQENEEGSGRGGAVALHLYVRHSEERRAKREDREKGTGAAAK
ncbi:hypothetical protein AMTR_s00014p00255990 [Amborella trichopoda]|uniref:Uncharacterized protein n=1 Tax=Amborella trichopoda TaxID=13333 RepID=W1PNE0_AMBTC|nr:hypothetical protein AMTR_s00014p00255990 [Amborella trichopoda]